jgi:hypothetical protein
VEYYSNSSGAQMIQCLSWIFLVDEQDEWSSFFKEIQITVDKLILSSELVKNHFLKIVRYQKFQVEPIRKIQSKFSQIINQSK